MTRPNVYVLGSNPEIRLATTDESGTAVEPTLVRLSIERPSGAIITVSGADMTYASDYYSYQFTTASGTGFYRYEGWIQDSSGNEVAAQNGFWVKDRVIN